MKLLVVYNVQRFEFITNYEISHTNDNDRGEMVRER